MCRIIFIFIFLSSFALKAQEADKAQILKDSGSFISALEQKNYEHFIELMYPSIFEMIDKEFFINAIKGVYEGNDEYKIEIINTKDTKFEVSEIFESQENKMKYAFVSYPLCMKMTFLEESFDEETKKMMIGLMTVEGMEVEFIDDNTIKMDKLSMTIAIKDEITNHTWKYLNHDNDNPFYTSFIPAEIVRKARDYYFELILKQKENGS